MSGAVAALRLDGEGRLLGGDEAALTLNARAGGRMGAVLAVPALNDLARAARRLGVAVARSVAAADGEAVWDIDVRARPDTDGIQLLLSGWRERAEQPPSLAALVGQLAAESDWRWEADAGLRLIHLPPEAGERHGIEAMRLLGRSLTELFTFMPDKAGGLPILSALSERRSFSDQPATIRGTDDDAIVSGIARHDADGVFLGFSGGVRHVPAPGTIEPEGSPALAQPLGRALRTPLTRIVADADDLRTDRALGETYSGYAADIAAAGRHLLALIDDLADLEAVERPDLPLTFESIDLAELARRAGGLLAVRAAATDVTVERPAGGRPLMVRGDHRRTLQILINLTGNAVRYAPPGSVVTLSLGSRDGSGWVTVADAGPGISVENQARIFGKFERVDASEPGGSGLGLYIARRLARAMGGDVVLESAAGAGARFSLTLPLAP